jgi:hypothetical protein
MLYITRKHLLLLLLEECCVCASRHPQRRVRRRRRRIPHSFAYSMSKKSMCLGVCFIPEKKCKLLPFHSSASLHTRRRRGRVEKKKKEGREEEEEERIGE